MSEGKPTIAELERILAGGDGPQRITMLPNGEIRAVSDWQPIETAEKTTQSRLVYCPERKNTYCVYWGSYSTSEDDIDGWCIFGAGGRYLSETPTHWMKIPAPPAANPRKLGE